MVELFGKKLEYYSDEDIHNFIRNYENKGATQTEEYLELVKERAKRAGPKLSLDKSIGHLLSCAKNGNFTTYGELAKANGVNWNEIRYQMSGEGGHLDQLLDYCHAKGLPLLTAICVNQENVETGELEPAALKGFIGGVKRLEYSVTDEKEFLKKCQKKCFEVPLND